MDSARELTDAKMWKLAQMFTSENDLYTLALLGLHLADDIVSQQLRDKGDSIVMATYSVLKVWRLKQTNLKVAYTKMCGALLSAKMAQFASNALDFEVS